MSSAGRGPRLGGKNDNYETPSWCVYRILEQWNPRAGLLIEPCVGNGAIVRAFNNFFSGSENEWYTFDIRDSASRADEHTDFLKVTNRIPEAVAVITNPPYCLAEKFVRHCRHLYPFAEIVMLLRMGFLESEERFQFFREVGIPDLYGLPNRPSFRNKKTDSASYGWMRWPPGPARSMGIYRHLGLTPLSTRRERKHGIRQAAQICPPRPE